MSDNQAPTSPARATLSPALTAPPTAPTTAPTPPAPTSHPPLFLFFTAPGRYQTAPPTPAPAPAPAPATISPLHLPPLTPQQQQQRKPPLNRHGRPFQPQPFTCNACGKTFSRPKTVQEHFGNKNCATVIPAGAAWDDHVSCRKVGGHYPVAAPGSVSRRKRGVVVVEDGDEREGKRVRAGGKSEEVVVVDWGWEEIAEWVGEGGEVEGEVTEVEEEAGGAEEMMVDEGGEEWGWDEILKWAEE